MLDYEMKAGLWICIIRVLNGKFPASCRLFSSFQTNKQKFYNKYMWINVHPIYRAVIWTRDLQHMSLLPDPLGQGSRRSVL